MYLRKKTIAACLIAVVCICVAAVCAWRLMPATAKQMDRAQLVVERTSWHEICADGHPILFFDTMKGDSAILGVTANRDSATHVDKMAGCWIDEWVLVPSCRGHVACVDRRMPGNMKIGEGKKAIEMCQRSVEKQLQTLGYQKSELDYYIRVHGVQDNGYQQIAALRQKVDAAYLDVMRAKDIIDSIAGTANARLTVKSHNTYTAVFHSNGKVCRTAMNMIKHNGGNGLTLLQTTDHNTPDGVATVRVVPWTYRFGGDVCCTGIGGLGEDGLACDTVWPTVVPGHVAADGKHDFPKVLASDGCAVYSLRGRFAGLISGDSVVSRRQLRSIFDK